MSGKKRNDTIKMKWKVNYNGRERKRERERDDEVNTIMTETRN